MKPRKNIDDMSLDEIRAYNKELRAKLDRMLAERRAELEPATTPTPDPAPVVEDAPTLALPTAKMRKAIARFDDLDDSAQIDVLSQMWGPA